MRYDDILNIQDLLVAPIYLIFLICIALLLRKRYTKGQPHIKRYFMPALYVRFLGCLLSALMYQYYYHGGDTFVYFNGAATVWYSFWNNTEIFYQFYTISPENYPTEIYSYFAPSGAGYLLTRAANTMVIQIGGLLSLITFKSYLSIGLIITFFSFLGCWKLFEIFNDQYPNLHKHIAIATLFIPSVFFWGAAGLMKDTIIMAAVGYVVWGAYYFFIKRKKRITSLLYMGVGGFIVLTIKTYVALALFPALALWIFLQINANIRSRAIKVLAFPILIIIGGIAASVVFQQMATAGEQKYHPENIMEYAQGAAAWHKLVTEQAGGVGYDLGTFTPTIGGLLSTIPKAINVTLFRPYPWEFRKVILFPAMLESLVAFFLTLYVFFKVGFFRTFYLAFSTPVIAFCLSFSLVFAFALGFSTYNFGALARYKTPCLPFYFVGLVLLLEHRAKKKRKVAFG